MSLSSARNLYKYERHTDIKNESAICSMSAELADPKVKIMSELSVCLKSLKIIKI